VSSDAVPPPPSRRIAPGVVLGLVTAGVAIGVAHLVAGLANPEASPIVAVGRAAVDATPEWLKDWAIRTFGARDKFALLVGIGIVLGLVSMALGVASVRRASVGLAGIAGLGAIGIAAVLTRPDAELADAIPTALGAAAATGTFVALRGSTSELGRNGSVPTVGFDRRRFLLLGAGGAVGAALAGGLGSVFARRFRADASRAEVRIPTPASGAGSAPVTGPSIAELSPFTTPNDRFYRVDTALIVPAVMAEDWRLRVHGMVDREITLDYEQLLARPLIERDLTLACVSNPLGGEYVGNARWVGAPLKDLLEEAGVHAGADQIVSTSADGFTAGTPTAVATDGREAMLAVAMNGQPLPLEHGFPVRMIVPGLYGYVSATKWLVDLELTTFDAYDAYWIVRGWAQQAPVKTMSRIDTPRASAELGAGAVTVAGVAWAQHRGIERVEVRADDGPWIEADLTAPGTIDTWRQWVVRWDATPGDHTLQVRATDGTGETQTADLAEPFPDGATGYHTVFVRVR
jgi:DMSO/TMAO reductase YedYZ molybdopterin-dependent catalytic subunit